MPLWFRRSSTNIESLSSDTAFVKGSKVDRSTERGRCEARRLGDEARDRKDWVTAANLYERHLDATPNDGAIWIQLGHARKELNHLPAAEKAYLQAAVLMPDDADLALQLGHFYKIAGKSGKAILFYRKSVELAYTEEATRELIHLTTTAGIEVEVVAQNLVQHEGGAEPLLNAVEPIEVPHSMNEELVRAVYLTFLGREPEPRGLEIYTAALRSGLSTYALLQEFASQEECILSNKENQGESDRGSVSAETLISAVYRAVLDRDPDPIGITNYGSALRGGMTAEALIAEFLAMRIPQPKTEDPLVTLCVSIREMAISSLARHGCHLQLGPPNLETGSKKLLANKAADMLFTMQSIMN